jgi:hypothetical protein
MTKFKIGDTVKIKETKQVGKVVSINDKGIVEQVDVNGDIVSTVGLILEIVGIIKQIWYNIKKLFTKSAKNV